MTDEHQRMVLDHYTGPMLAIAGPGSGKTYSLTHRICELITTRGVDPSSILVITFTKSAALGMQQRFYDLMSGEPAVTFGTFHSIFFTMLNEKHHFRLDDVLTECDRRQIFADLLGRIHVKHLDADEVSAEVSYCVNCMADRAVYQPRSAPVHAFWDIYDRYRRIKQERHLLDFDDMLLLAYEMFRDDEQSRHKWQARFPFLMIDEFQDVNPLQYETLKLLAPPPSSNVFAVGDDDQSIYGFRGSDPAIMQRFTVDYADCCVVTLGTNYRSGPHIVQMASRLIAKNENRFPKEIVAANGFLDLITCHTFESAREEAEQIVNILRRDRSRGQCPSTAVLFRNHAQASYLLSLLNRYQIPYYEGQRLSSLTDHFICKDIRSYLTIAAGRGQMADYLRILNRPRRGISRLAVETDSGGFEEILSYYKGNRTMTAVIDRFRQDCVRISHMRPVMAITYIRRAMGYDAFLSSYSSSQDTSLDELLDIVCDVADLARPFKSLGDFLDELDRLSSASAVPSSPEDSMVSLYTYHGSKGLEFSRVFLIDCNEGYTPSPKAKEKGALEEERRMFYVAVTRAKQELHLYTVKSRRNAVLKPSRFLSDMQEG